MTPAVESEQLVVDKQPIKWMELPVMKFNEVAIPHHVNRLKTLKANIIKCQRTGDWSGAHREQANANVVIKQLRTLVKEMDVLRSRVIESDLHKFDKMIDSSRRSALNILQEYIDLPHHQSSVNYCNGSNHSDRDNYFGGCYEDIVRNGTDTDVVECQLQNTLEISRLETECRDQERCSEEWENLQKEIVQVQQLYQELACIVETQKEAVTQIETSVQSAQENVEQGEKVLVKAARLKVASYPLTGAIIGSFMGGPVGIIAGFKLGSIVALTCSILGFTGGKILKQKQNIKEVHPHAS